MVDAVLQFAHSNPLLFSGIVLGMYIVFNAFVAGMPPPRPNASIAYQWCFASFHALAFNLDKFVATRGLPFFPANHEGGSGNGDKAG